MLASDTLDAPESATSPLAVRAPDDRGFRYDGAAADAAVKFFPRYLKLTKDRWAGKPFVLAAWQEHDIVRPLFGWKRADGTRRYRRCIVWVARKNGKTELAAGISLLMLIGDALFGAEVYSIAADEDQAKIVFDKAQLMVGMSEELSAVLETPTTSIFCPQTQGAFKALSGRPKGKHGLNMSGLIGDEVHEWPDDRLYTFIHQSTGARLEPLEFLISTAGIIGEGYGWELWQESCKIRDGIIDDPETLVVIYGADEKDDWQSEETWKKANPNYGVSPTAEYMRAEAKKAAESPRRENDFKRYHLNLWTEQAIRWLTIESWDACQVTDWRDEAALVGRPCFGGLDLASTQDIAALVWAFPPDEEGGIWRLAPRFWVPERTLKLRVKRDRVPYDLFKKEGALFTTEGNVTDYRVIRKRIVEDAEKFSVKLLGIDRWNSTQTAVELQDEGIPVGLVGQGYQSLSAPSKLFEQLVISGLLDHGAHPVLRWMAKNVAIERDPADNIKPTKEKSSEKIDGIVGAIMGLFCATNGEPAEENIGSGAVVIV
ncbi:Phage terminase-like protein, large subunit, contains N-terminal HTH domain [Rhizobiales bacterium GAS188]|nr:Phage terminase-like protein, large subunit, contains N-terminal HTH domain [Rhizobiales bacterium GAS188]